MQVQKWFYLNYDLDATSYRYGRLGDNQGFAHQGLKAITAANSTTVTSTVANARAFQSMAVGDVIVVITDNLGTTVQRKVATKTSDDEITISGAAVTWTGITAWRWMPFAIGTAATDGWHGCSKDQEKQIQIDIATVAAAGGIDLQIEAMGYGGTLPAAILTKNYDAATSEIIPIMEPCAALRVGVKGGSGFAGTDDITVTYLGTPRR